MILGGVYLNALYVAHWKEQMKTILSEARVFGIAVFGDGATIKTVPLIIYYKCAGCLHQQSVRIA
jgi:hypothetical protein